MNLHTDTSRLNGEADSLHPKRCHNKEEEKHVRCCEVLLAFKDVNTKCINNNVHNQNNAFKAMSNMNSR